MKNWIKSQCDIYNTYSPLSFSLPLNVKTLFKNYEFESENVTSLLEDNNNQSQVTKTTKRIVSGKRRNHHGVDSNGNNAKCEKSTKSAITDNQVWRRLSLQSYKKRKQEKEAQKTKPLIPSVLRTYDKRGMQKSTPDWL